MKYILNNPIQMAILPLHLCLYTGGIQNIEKGRGGTRGNLPSFFIFPLSPPAHPEITSPNVGEPFGVAFHEVQQSICRRKN